MVTRWKVTYEFETGIQVQKPVLNYPNIGLTIKYDGYKLLKMEHELDTDGSVASESKAIEKSKAELTLFWELLQYRWGLPLPPFKSMNAEKLQQQQSPIVRTGFQHCVLDALICETVVMPEPVRFPYDNKRILIWLWLANDARNSGNAMDAIRNYYMIWEDLYPKWDVKNGPREAQQLKHVRDFVSHGGKLTHASLLDFLKDEFKEPVEQFDPTEPTHCALVKHCRNQSRKLIEDELDKLL